MNPEHPDDNMPLRQRRLKARENAARKRGYLGSWPPRWPIVESPKQFEAVLEKVEDGEHRAAYVHTLGRRLVAFYASLTPEHFRRLAAVAKAVILDKGTAPRVRLRGIQTVMRPLCEAVTLLAREPHRQPTAAPHHLEACLGAFYAEISDDDFRDFVAVLRKLVRNKKPQVRHRAAKTMLRLLMDCVDLLAKLEALPRYVPMTPEEAERIRAARARADAELDEIERQLEEEERRRGGADS